jgi:hypothetical protein
MWARNLLDPKAFYQPLEEKQADKLKEALTACQAGDQQAAMRLFNKVIDLAKASSDL